jgi:hypothetical protein
LAPSAASVLGAAHVATPESASLQAKLTVTGRLVQLFARYGPPGVVADVVIVGGVLSSFNVTLPEPVSPDVSVAVHVNKVPAVSAVATCGSQPTV